MPTKIRFFWWLALAYGVVSIAWGLFHREPASNDTFTGELGTVLLGDAFSLSAVGAAWLITYRRVRGLRWFVAAIYVAAFYDISATHSLTRFLSLSLPQALLGLGAIYCVFSQSAQEWLAQRSTEDQATGDQATGDRARRFLIKAAAVVCGALLGIELISIVSVKILALVGAAPNLSEPALSEVGQAHPPSDPSAIAAGQLFTDACLAHIGHPDQVRAWAADNQLNVITDPASLHDYAGDGPKGGAWQLRDNEGNLLLSIRAESEACAVWARKADPADAAEVFKGAIEALKQPDSNMAVTGDETPSTPRGKAHVLKYELFTPSTGMAAVFSMITAAQAGGPYQLMYEVLGRPASESPVPESPMKTSPAN